MNEQAALVREDARDDDVTAELRIQVRRNGAMSVAGCIQQEAYAIAMLDAARESIRSHNRRQINGGGLILPPERTFQA